jgi:TonB-linked SusC/RagA family outer membrane protein
MGLQNSNILTFHKVFNSMHDVTVTGVYEQSKSQYDYTSVNGSGSPFTDKLQYYALNTMVDKTIGSYYSMSSLRSYVGRANYILSNKYMITASFRADGSSKFPNNKWGYFPSTALGWRASEEPFIKDLNLFSNLKVRGGWGVTGNQGAGPFTTIPKMSNGAYAYGTSSGTYSRIDNSVGDPNLKWEQTAQTDIGVDMGFFNNRLNVSADYYNKQTKDLLLPVPIPIYWGGGSKLTNIGSTENKGFELVLSGMPVETKDISWNVTFNISSIKNKVLELGGGSTFINSNITPVVGTGNVDNNLLRNIVGESMGTFWGNKFLGIYQESESAEAAKYGLHPGDSKYLDLNNDLKIDGEDKVIIGHAYPKYTWGLDNTVRFKDFELNLFIIGVQGNNIFNMDYALAATRFGDSRTITSADVQSWTPENKNNTWPKLTSTTNVERLASSKWIQDGSFVRVKNLSLSYRFPESMIKGAPLKLAVSSQNLLTFTKYKGPDPEAASGGDDDINQGLVSGAYPAARTFTFSLQFSF